MLAGVFTTIAAGIIGLASLGLTFKRQMDLDDRPIVEQPQEELILVGLSGAKSYMNSSALISNIGLWYLGLSRKFDDRDERFLGLGTSKNFI
ncbi:unnamed protein product [Rotaria socialis]|uniref:Uncharacterized protein n=1 Tax=Rotaria socialis TaxID=392032 RepID=A0A818RDV7_9BILA|nr:unnamed protein product [Rotaria socialis]CAF3656025.1 unnamed protein product [Rotaria socialis]